MCLFPSLRGCLFGFSLRLKRLNARPRRLNARMFLFRSLLGCLLAFSCFLLFLEIFQLLL